MAKIGIMGGTFNPIHKGHIKLAHAALKEMNLDKVWFMPSKNPPHKIKANIVSDFHRMNMIKLAIKNYKHFELSDIEMKREGITYTSDTLEYLQQIYTEDTFYFILGADSLINIEKWHLPNRLFELTSFIVAVRDNINKIKLQEHCSYLMNKYKTANINILDMDKIDVSSSNLRKNTINHNSINNSLRDEDMNIFRKHLGNIDSAVYEYIQNNGLYKNI